MNIYVGNLPKDATDFELEDLFKGYGNVRSVKIIRDLFSGESKGFGFVEMNDKEEAQKALDELNTKEFKGNKIIVNEARPKNTNRRGGGGRGNSGRGGNRGGGGRRSW